MPADPIQAMEFAQSKGQARKEGTTGISFEDVAGLSYIQEELQDIVSVGMHALRTADTAGITIFLLFWPACMQHVGNSWASGVHASCPLC
jgi:hypothetical protein